ncbi:FAD/NAD(P)-binding domain-containing protein [Pleurotus eryngii]|uniref:FAD/NAD(P)-binding domain-containing protein n=1 Tax=Pleurotus eryngii TaxID=5323 RepID=A0A9P6AAQ7_PLEER|nr:FAD/NAD(P)-binding domain-containing protein [Pleurotus eryngii]
MASKDFTVAIVGGGMCGLVCAYTLKKAGIAVEVFEAAPEFGEVGAGVGLGPNAVRALDRLGVLSAVLTRSEHSSPVLRPFLFVSGYDAQEAIYDQYSVGDDDRGLPIHRAAFLDAIIGISDMKIAHLNKRCVAIQHTHALATASNLSSTLFFSDGTSHRAHLVIGADGIKSTVRKYVVDPLADDAEHNTNSKNKTNLAFSGSLAYRGLLPNSTVVAAGVKIDLTVQPVCFCGIDRHIITFPIQAGRIINVVAFSSITRGDSAAGSLDELPHPWVQPVAKQELAETFQTRGWGADSDAIKLLNCMERPSRWSIHTVDPPLSSYVDPERGIALIGDAAHGMLPHLGAGVGQGFEDVVVLTELLSHPETNLSNLEHVLGAYDSARRSRGNTVLEASARMGRITERYGKSGYSNEEMRTQLAGIWGPVWHHDLSEDVNKAVEMLREKRVFKEAESS